MTEYTKKRVGANLKALDFTLNKIDLELSSLSSEQKWYLATFYIRSVEEKIAREYQYGQMRTPVHLCIGQEAIAVGVSHNLEHRDQVTSGHRSHGHYLAKGGDLTAMFGEILGRELGCAKGRGGSQHLIDMDANFVASAPILGGTVPIAAGLAFSKILKDEKGIVVTYLGDAVLEEGVLFETLSFSSLKKLPILFVVENNELSVHTHIQTRQPKRILSKIGPAFGLPSFEVFGNSVSEVSTRSGQLISKIRRGEGAAILFCRTYRQLEHVGPNTDLELGYRDIEEHEAWLRKDPLLLSKKKLSRKYQESIQLKASLSKISKYVEECWNRAYYSKESGS